MNTLKRSKAAGYNGITTEMVENLAKNGIEV